MKRDYWKNEEDNAIIKLLESLEGADNHLFSSLVRKGQLYEYFSNQLSLQLNRAVSRSESKLAMLVVFFSNKHMSKEKMIFKNCFPSVYALFSLIKKNNHKRLANLPQEIESQAVLKIVCKKITDKYPNIPILLSTIA